MRDDLRKKAGGEAIIINISLTSGMVGETSTGAYNAIKHAVRRLVCQRRDPG